MNVTSITSPAALAIEPLAHARAGSLKGAALRNASPAEQRAAVAAQFEAILVRQLLGKTMTSMLGGADSGAAGSIYGDMLADTVSQQITSGVGLGFGRFLEKQLTPRGQLVTEPAEPTAPCASSQAIP